MYDCDKLKTFCGLVMEHAGMAPQEARRFADSLVNADMRGVSSHGVTRLKPYYLHLVDGVVDAAAKPAIVAEMPSFLLIDGNNGMGVTTAAFAMEACIARAKETGACFAAARGGNHFGYAAYYSQMAAREGMIGVAMCNASQGVAPYGGMTAQLGTNPIAISVPGRDDIAFDLDMATSLVARGKIKLAIKKGVPIPPDWGIDDKGRPTTDPKAVSCAVPFGGYKGYGIGLAVEILTSCISGASRSQGMSSFFDLNGRTPQNVGYFFGALNVSGITDFDGFADRVEEQIRLLKSSPKAEGVEEILVAGEPEARRYRAALENGVDIPPAVLAELKELGERCGVPFDCEV